MKSERTNRPGSLSRRALYRNVRTKKNQKKEKRIKILEDKSDHIKQEQYHIRLIVSGIPA